MLNNVVRSHAKVTQLLRAISRRTVRAIKSKDREERTSHAERRGHSARYRALPPLRAISRTEPPCAVYLYTIHYAVIKTFRHKGLERFFSTGSKAGIQAKHAARLRLQLGRLDAATSSEDMNLAGWKLHPLKGNLRGYWAVWVDENWRLVFTFEGADAALVDYMDYH